MHSPVTNDGWHSRGYLPHWELDETPQFITFRLTDSLPSDLLVRWREELETLPDDKQSLERRRRIQLALDNGHGSLWLARPEIAEIVERALLHFDGRRYRMQAWVI